MKICGLGLAVIGKHLFREADIKDRVQLAFGNSYPFDEVKQ